MARTTGKSEKVELRVPSEELADWRGRAEAASLTLSAWLRQQAARPDTVVAALGFLPGPAGTPGAVRPPARFNLPRTLTPGAATPKRKDK